jgi:hypothetical protein
VTSKKRRWRRSFVGSRTVQSLQVTRKSLADPHDVGWILEETEPKPSPDAEAAVLVFAATPSCPSRVTALDFRVFAPGMLSRLSNENI